MAEVRGSELVTTVSAARTWARAAHGGGRRVALVPTMGALHAGHRALLEAARATGDRLVCSIFVNPRQFAPGEDLATYPRTLERDLALCAEVGVDLVFAPGDPAELYPEGFATEVRVAGLGEHLCGASRPEHFEGVATVVTKLFGILRPETAFFGEKDFQQLAVIRRFTRDLELQVEVRGVPTVREEDGLALSSRNANLDADARARAVCIPRAIEAVRSRFAQGERSVPALKALGRSMLEGSVAAPGVDAIDYLELADPERLVPLGEDGVPDGETRLFVAAFLACGQPPRRTRLIDNLPLGR